jgi:hypothetical protein
MNAMPWPLYPAGKRPGTHCTRVWLGPRAIWTGTENLTPAGFQPRTFQPVASPYTDRASCYCKPVSSVLTVKI